MREVIEQILDGTYDYEKGALDFSCAKLEIELQKGEIYEGSFTVRASQGKYTMGYVSSSDPRMECLTTKIQGNREEVLFRFHGEWMKEGEVSKGEFRIVSNKGEYYLPYVVTAVHSLPQSSEGPVKNLLHFTNLAKKDWKEAVKVFYTPDFAKVLRDTGEQTKLYYQGLSVQEGKEQHVEEFLIAAGKKERIEYLVTEKKIEVENPVGMVEQTLNIFRNGWGYTKLEVVCEGDFLFVEKELITEDDFLGNRFTLPIFVDAGLLHRGKNLGRVLLKGMGVEITIPVTVSNLSVGDKELSDRQEHKKDVGKLIQSFQNYRLKKMNKADWLKETTRIVDRMIALNEKDVETRLYQAHLLITKEQVNEADWVLEHTGELIDGEISPVLEAYYIYLNTLLRREEGFSGEMSWQVTKIYHECGEDWRVAWLLLFLTDEYSRNPVTRWNFLKEQFENGCRSPLIYLEALLLVNSNPTLMRALDDFEIQILYYGRRQECIGLEFLEHAISLMERVRDYHPLLLRFLMDCYRKKNDSRVLKEICAQLIKRNKPDKMAFEWFVKGIEAEIRITNLYEYFMMTLDLDEEKEIPRAALIYFTYQTNLDYLHSAYLFYYVTMKQHEFPDIYRNYVPRIELFLIEQIQKNRINPHLAYLYKRYLNVKTIGEDNAGNLSQLLFANEIRFKQKDIRAVIVCQPNHLMEQRYPVNGDRVWVPLYGKDSCILFENAQGIRLISNVDYSIQKLMSPMSLLNQIVPYVKNNPSMDIYIQEIATRNIEVSEEELERWQRLAEYTYLPDSMRADLVIEIIRYFYKKNDKKQLEKYLRTLAGAYMSPQQRGEIIRYMVLCDDLDRAYEWMEFYGNCKVEDRILLKLLEVRIEAGKNDGKLVSYAYGLLKKGIYSGILLQFLMQYYQGMTRELRNIWTTTRNYKLDRKSFCERMLIQVLFSGYYVAEQSEIFKEYTLAGGDEDIIAAYLEKNSYEFFTEERLISREVLVEISRQHVTGKNVSQICKLAYLKYYAENVEEIQPEDTSVIKAFLERLLQEGIHLRSFWKLREYVTMPMHVQDKTIVEYHTAKDKQPVIHYLIMNEEGVGGDYAAEPMKQVLGGVFTKEFVLFFGESVQYYIVEEEAVGEGKLTQSGTRRKGDISGEDMPGKYGIINDIIMSKAMQDYDTLDNLLEEYFKKDFYNQQLFKLR